VAYAAGLKEQRLARWLAAGRRRRRFRSARKLCMAKTGPKLLAVLLCVLAAALAPAPGAHAWSDSGFAKRPDVAYPIPGAGNDLIGTLTTYQVRKGDSLLDVGRWFGLTAREISEANGHLDWWLPPRGRVIVLPTEHILPPGARTGIVLNAPEMRLYYYYPSPAYRWRGKHLVKTAADGASLRPSVVYTFPVGLGRYDWKTPMGDFVVRGKTRNPTWVVPQDIYEEHLERDGEAEHVVAGGDPDNPLGLFRLELTLPEYAIHGTNNPWGVGLEVSHGCVRLYPEDIEHLFHKVKVGTPGRIIYEPVKFGWRDGALYVEVHEDLYARYPGLWKHAAQQVERLGLTDKVDMKKLEAAVEAQTGVPTYVMPGPEPGSGERG
jgi:L,D-transpeptidase ErfK/SrfK